MCESPPAAAPSRLGGVRQSRFRGTNRNGDAGTLPGPVPDRRGPICVSYFPQVKGFMRPETGIGGTFLRPGEREVSYQESAAFPVFSSEKRVGLRIGLSRDGHPVPPGTGPTLGWVGRSSSSRVTQCYNRWDHLNEHTMVLLLRQSGNSRHSILLDPLSFFGSPRPTASL